MSSNELNELLENSERAHHDSSIAPVTMTMMVIAVFVAVVSIIGHRTHTSEVMIQDEVSSKWGHYQAKVIRGTTAQMFADLSSSLKSGFDGSDPTESFQSEANRYQAEKKEIEEEAGKLKANLKIEKDRAKRIDLAEVLLEISLILTSITLLSGVRTFWYFGIGLCMTGVSLASIGLIGW